MRIKIPTVISILFSISFSQVADYNYGDKYATFTSPACGDILTVGQTYKIKWKTNVDPNVVTGSGTYDKVYLYIFSDGVSGKYCDGDAHPYGYNVSAGRLSIRDNSSVDLTGSSTMTNNAANGTAEFEWTVQHHSKIIMGINIL